MSERLLYNPGRDGNRKLTRESSNKGRMPLDSFSIAQRRTKPFPAPEAARSLLLHTATELTQERAVEPRLNESWALISVEHELRIRNCIKDSHGLR